MKQEVQNLFNSGKLVKLVFTKTDGSTRTMKCTVNSDYIQSISYSKAPEREDIKNVWDLEKEAWRSFRWDSLISFEEIVDGEAA